MARLTDRLPCHGHDTPQAAEAKRVMIRGRAKELREMADALDALTRSYIPDTELTERANLILMPLWLYPAPPAQPLGKP